ncbi:MAG TPA: hypothetical protein VGM36_12305 [Rhizomicrobium sp.]
MSWIIEHIDWVLIVSGALTFTMAVMVIAPRFVSRFAFGETADGALGNLISRSWGEMVAASGLMLLYAAYHPETRLPILLYSIAGKTGFIVLVLSNKRFHRQRAMQAALVDAIMVGLFAWYLLAA